MGWLAMLWTLAAAAQTAGGGMIEYGVTSRGEPVEQYTLRNANGMTVRFISLGGIVTAIEVPDRDGRLANVVLGLPDLERYETRNESYRFGAIMGRYAGRIAGARFSINGHEVRLQANDGENALHGGAGRAFDAQIWRVERIDDATARLTYSSPDGEQGFPGRLDVAVTYKVTPDNALRIDYEAHADAPTVLNLTNHSYFNLSGAGAGPVYGDVVQVFGNRIVAVDDRGIPTGGYLDVAGTPFDFREARPLGDCIEHAMPRIDGYCGYNHSWMVERDSPGALALAARVTDPASGRTLEVETTEPTVHLYVANHFPGTDIGNAGIPLAAHTGLALETQHLPDSPNHPEFPTTLLRPGESFRSTTIFRFGVAPAG